MRGSSAGSLTQLTDALASAIAAGGQGAALGDALFVGAAALRESAALRRAATDPSAPAEAKSGLMSGLFADKLGADATEILATAAGLRWATGSDLVNSLEQLAVVAHVRGAEAQGDGDRLEDELFGLAQVIVANRDLRDALSDPSRSVGDKQALLINLLGAKALPATVRLASRAVEGAHGTASAALTTYSKLAAEARSRLVAKVTVAAPLAASEQDRLAAVLARDYGQPVHLNIVINPAIVGGIRVEIGDQMIDGTVSARIDDATRRLAG
jgi:F-type H+-transporting ATPase subunit delta